MHLECAVGQIEKFAILTVYDIVNPNFNAKFVAKASEMLKTAAEIQS